MCYVYRNLGYDETVGNTAGKLCLIQCINSTYYLFMYYLLKLFIQLQEGDELDCLSMKNIANCDKLHELQSLVNR